jgi:hypothetical protein
MSRQLHGFIYEKNVIDRYKLYKCKEYTSKYDAFTTSNIPVQIKCRKYKSSIYFGDFIRTMNTKEDFILIVGTWKNNKSNISSEDMIYVNCEKFKRMCHWRKIHEYKEYLKCISNDVSDDLEWKKFLRKCKNEYPSENLIKMNMKRDHKKQKRIQCSLSYKNYIKFKMEFKDIKI